jgi:uncharacterized protein YbjQ (UPF0145 family)
MAVSGLAMIGPVAAHADEQSGAAAPVFVSNTREAPQGFRTVASVEGQACAKSGQPSPTDADAVEALRANARQMGAEGVINVKFYRRQPGPAPRASLVAQCWQMTQATGTAVMRAAPEGAASAVAQLH